jgi:hypothetical protein
MSTSVQIDEGLFDGGPPIGLQKSLHLMGSAGDRRIAQRVAAAVVLGWGPLVVLSGIREMSFGIAVLHSFLTDVGTHAQLLIAVPLLLMAEADAIPRFGRVACHFSSCGVIGDRDLARYSAAVESTRALLNSRLAEVVTFLLAYALVIARIFFVRPEAPAWQFNSSAPFGLSVAGMWHAWVSLPLFLTLCLGWLWRILLWWRFLALMSRLNLRLIAAHPDHCGGLQFVSISIRGYRLLAFAIASVIAGKEIGMILNTGKPLAGYKNGSIGVLIVVLMLAVGPLLVFVRNLRETKVLGTLKYGTLGVDAGVEFERKWLNGDSKTDASVLEVGDFSAMTDLYQVVGNVYEMKVLPFALKNLDHLVIGALVPFLPLVLMSVPLKELLRTLVKLLF